MDGAPEAAPRYRVGSSHSGADFEAGRLGHRNGEAPNDGAEHEVVNAHEPEPTRSAGQRSINSFLSGAASENEWSAGAPGRKKQKKAASAYVRLSYSKTFFMNDASNSSIHHKFPGVGGTPA